MAKTACPQVTADKQTGLGRVVVCGIVLLAAWLASSLPETCRVTAQESAATAKAVPTLPAPPKATWQTAIGSGEVRQVPAAASTRTKPEPRMHRVLAVAVSPEGELLFIGEPLGSRPAEFGLTREDLLDFLATALQAELRGESPGVSIDQAKGGVLEPGVAMPVRYLGGVEQTFLGHTLFEADRWLKCLGMGRNNLDGTPLVVNLPNGVPHYTVLEFRGSLLAQNVGAAPDASGSLNRFWFMPEVSGLVVSKDERVVSLVTPVVVETEAMVMRPGLDAQGAGKKDPASEQFARHLSRNLDAYGERYAVFVWLREAAKMVTLARALVTGTLPEPFQQLDLPRFSQRHQAGEFPTLKETPAILATLNLQQAGAVLQLGAVGGVDLTPRGLTPPDASEQQRQQAYGKVERLKWKPGAEAHLDPQPLADSLSQGQPPRLANENSAVVFRVSLAANEPVPGEQTVAIVDQALAESGISRRYRAGQPRRSALRMEPFEQLARNTESRRSEIRSDNSLGGGWELVAPQLTCGAKTQFQGLDAKLPQMVTLQVPGDPPIVFDELLGRNATLEYHASRSPGERLEVVDAGKSFRYVKDAVTAEFDEQGRLARLRNLQVSRDKEGRATEILRDGQQVLQFQYADGQLARVEDAAGNVEEYRYRQGRLVAVRVTAAGGEPQIAWNDVNASSVPNVASVPNAAGVPKVAGVAGAATVTNVAASPSTVPRVSRVSTAVLNIERKNDGVIEFGQLGKPKAQFTPGAAGLRELPDHLRQYLQPLLEADAPRVVMLHSKSLTNLELLQQQLIVQRALSERGIAVVSTRSGQLAQATQHLQAAEKLRVQRNGAANVAVVACPHLFAARNQAEQAVRETLPAFRALPAFRQETWVNTPVDSVGDVDSVVLWGQQREAWDQDLNQRGERGEFAGKHVVLLVQDAQLNDIPFQQAMQRSAALADRVLDFGAILVDGYYVDVEPEVSAAVTRQLASVVKQGMDPDTTPQAALEQALQQLDDPQHPDPKVRRLNSTIQRMRQNLFKRTEVQPRALRGTSPAAAGVRERLFCWRLGGGELPG